MVAADFTALVGRAVRCSTPRPYSQETPLPTIDVHGHLTPPARFWAYKSRLLSNSGHHGSRPPEVSDEEIVTAMSSSTMSPQGHLDLLADRGIDLQFLSAPQTSTMTSETPERIVHWFTEFTNDLLIRTTRLFPGKFEALCGLPQPAGRPIEESLPELERCVELGFRGCMVNPDPFENRGPQAPALGDEYWYPLYDALCRHGLPVYIHAGASRTERTPYNVHSSNEETIAIFSLLSSRVFEDFPDLQVIIAHGGGGFPYQMGRFEPWFARVNPDRDRLSHEVRRLYFDTMLYSIDSLRLLITTVGADRCLFGTEMPGVGSITNPTTGRAHDDMVPLLQEADWLSEEDLRLVLEENATRLFGLDRQPAADAAAS